MERGIFNAHLQNQVVVSYSQDVQKLLIWKSVIGFMLLHFVFETTKTVPLHNTHTLGPSSNHIDITYLDLVCDKVLPLCQDLGLTSARIR